MGAIAIFLGNYVKICLMLSDAEVKKIAKLARIEISDKEVEKFKKDLSSILDFVNKLNEVSTDNIEPLYQTTGIVNSTRPDLPRRQAGESRGEFIINDDLNEKLINQAPHKENRFVKVKSVLNK